MKVSRLPVDPGPAAWNSLLPTIPPRSSLEGDVTADWLIIGGGFAGLSAARRLAQLHAGQRIVVLEASRIAEGPAGRNSGFMIDLPHDLTSADYAGDSEKSRREIRLNRAGIAYALDAKHAYSMGDEAVDTCGKVNAAMTPRGQMHNEAYARHLENLAEPYQRLDAGDMQKLAGTDCFIDGLYTPGTVMIQPALYMRNLAAGIESNRVQIHEASPVIELEPKGPDWQARTPSGTVTAPKVILCVNGHLESFGFYRRRLVHVFTYASMTRALTPRECKTLGGQRTWAVTPADPLGTTVRRISGTGGDRIIIRNRATFDPTMEVGPSRLAQVARTHDHSFRSRFPMLKSVAMEFRWGGRLCLSRNNVSVFGEIEPNLFAACCQNGLGTAKGTISGKLCAELASDISSSLLDDQQADEEPVRLPPVTIVTLGANAILRWGEYRAGKEL